MKVVIAWLNNNDPRCQLAQRRTLRSILNLGFDPVIVNGTPRPFLNEMLVLARSLTPDGGHFMWLNSDCEIEHMPEPHPTHVIGMHRVESLNGAICPGVDGYVIPCATWDKYYAPDLPSMYCGGTHVDWWLSRLAQKVNRYHRRICLLHLSHERTDASAGLDEHGKHNLREFHAWAARNEVFSDYE